MEEDVFIYGEIGVQFTSEDFLHVGKDVDTVNIHISSQGGQVFEGYAIHNRILELRRQGVKVIAKIEGLCASIATFIALGADRIEMAPAAIWMIHNPFNQVIGDSATMEKESKRLRRIEDQLVQAYVDKTGRSPEEIRELMKEEAEMGAKEARRFGFIDSISKTPEPVARWDKGDFNFNDMSEEKEKVSNEFEKELEKMISSYETRIKALEEKSGLKAEVKLDLADGGSVYVDSEDGEIEGKSVYTDESMSEPAPDGVHALEDGRQITVASGVVESVSEAAEDKEGEEVAELEAKLAEQEAYNKELMETIAEQNKQLDEIRNEVKELGKIKNMFVGKNKEVAEPKDEIKPKKAGEKRSMKDFYPSKSF